MSAVDESAGEDATSSDASLARSSIVMAAGTLVSRILGLARNALTAAVIGFGIIAADAWNAANTLPNLFHLLLAGGVLNAVIVPQITKAMRHEDGGVTYVNRLLTLAMTVMAAVTVILVLAAPWLVRLFTSSSWDGPSRGLATAFAVICMPQVFFYGLYTLLGQVLAAKSRFAAFMWAPSLANLVAIAGLAWFPLTGQTLKAPVSQWTPTMIAVLAGSATISIMLQALVLIPSLMKIGFRYRPVWGLRGSGLGSASRMAMWAFGAVVVGQAGYIVTSNVLTGSTQEAAVDQVQVAGLSGYSQAFLLFMLLHSLITVSLVTALFTRLSHAAHDRDTAAVTADLRRGMRMPAVILIPGTAASILLAPLVLQTTLIGNDRSSTDTVVGVLVGMMIGLVPYGWLYLIQRAFYAYEDGRTPLILQVVVTTIATGFNLYAATRPPEQVATWVGIGQSVSNLAAATLGFYLLRRKLGPLGLRSVLGQNLKLIIAAGFATAIGWFLLRALVGWLGSGWSASAVIALIVGFVILLLSMVGAAKLNVREVDDVIDRFAGRVLKRRRPRHARRS